jgi:UV DNA damage repair endonuclease
VNSEELIEVYHKATIAADNYNILELFQICVDLKIPIELDMEDIDVLNFLIQKKKEEIKKIETSFIWLWINAKTDEEKYNVVKMFVEQTSST